MAMMINQHKMTITDLVGVYASALLALIPHAERVHMRWREGESYDDWDAIAEALWNSFVVSPMADALSGGTPLQLPRYGFAYDIYSFDDVLAVSGPAPEIWVVQQLVLNGSQAPSIKVARVRRSDKKRIGHDGAPLGSAVSLVRFRADSSEERISEITLE